MGSIAFLFPGQGSQYVGMGADCYEHDHEARELFARADQLLGYKLSLLCFYGPEDELRQTRNTQPAIFVHSMVIAAGMKGKLSAEMAAGHSLGEYSALTLAGALSFDDALKLVRLRGESMQVAGERQKGTMAAVIGLSPEMVEDVCREASAAGIAVPANFNSADQTVISGSIDGVRKAMDVARTRGARLVKELVVSGAFHSPLMAGAKNALKKALDSTDIRDAAIPVFSNVTAEPVIKASTIRECLYLQMTSPVQWENTMKNMARDGADTFIELGPGKVLQGLVKRTLPSADTRGVATYQDLHGFAR